MRKKMLRSVLVAAFSAVVAFGALSGLSDGKGDYRADTHWPSVVVDSKTATDTGSVSTEDSGTGS